MTGLKAKTNAGRPNWDKIFQKLQDERKGKITVFYCGNPVVANILRAKCEEYGFNFRKEVFWKLYWLILTKIQDKIFKVQNFWSWMVTPLSIGGNANLLRALEGLGEGTKARPFNLWHKQKK